MNATVGKESDRIGKGNKRFVFSDDGPPCSPPDPIENGLASWDGRSKGARYACFQGYHLVGPPRIECRSA